MTNSTLLQAVTDPENQPNQFGVPTMRPISELDRTTDNTYLVLVESEDGKGWFDKAYYADDEGVWYDGNANVDPYVGVTFGKVERGPWRITAFAPWPEYPRQPVRGG
jgi:hypothetical protein